MRRVFLICFISVFLWFGLKDWTYQTFYSQGPAINTVTPDYAEADNWAARPDTPPPGAWERPWGVDVFLLLPPSSAPAKHGLIGPDNKSARNDMTRSAEIFSDMLANAGPVYAPLFRQASPALRTKDKAAFDALMLTDIQAAFAYYLNEDNRGRAILIATSPGTETLLQAINARILTDPSLAERIAGTVVFSNPRHKSETALTLAPCNESLAEQCLIPFLVQRKPGWFSWLRPNLPVMHVRYRLAKNDEAPHILAARADAISLWLDANAPKPAEPLGGLEMIEIAPIRLPGETDDVPDMETVSANGP